MAHSPNGQNGAVNKARPIALTADAFGRLVFTDVDGQDHIGVEPVRAFPLTDPAGWIALVDAEGHEICTLESLDALPADARDLLKRELAAREFVPVVTRVVRIAGDIFPTTWQVETDRGPTTLQLDSEDDIRRIGSHRVLITDARKMRYHVPDTRALDAYSRRVLERFV